MYCIYIFSPLCTEGNQEGDGAQGRLVRVTIVTGVRNNQQTGDLDRWRGSIRVYYVSRAL